MRKCFVYLTAIFLIAGCCYADVAGVNRIMKKWNDDMKQWELAYSAADPAFREKLQSTRPNPDQFVRPLWGQLASVLDKTESAEGVIWMFNHIPSIGREIRSPQSMEVVGKLLDAVNDHLTEVDGIGKIAYAVAASNDYRCKQILTKIRSNNPNPVDQGLAALGLAISMTETNGLLKDDPRLNRVRITYIREAILKSCDELFGKQTVTKVSSELLYELNNLSNGRKSPSFSIKSSDGRVVTVPSGEPTLLVFCSPDDLSSMKMATDADILEDQYPGLKVLPICPVDEKGAKEVIDITEMRTPLYMDTKSDVFKQFRIVSVPFVYYIDPSGIIKLRGQPDMLFEQAMKQAMLASNQPAKTLERIEKDLNATTPASADQRNEEREAAFRPVDSMSEKPNVKEPTSPSSLEKSPSGLEVPELRPMPE